MALDLSWDSYAKQPESDFELDDLPKTYAMVDSPIWASIADDKTSIIPPEAPIGVMKAGEVAEYDALAELLTNAGGSIGTFVHLKAKNGWVLHRYFDRARKAEVVLSALDAVIVGEKDRGVGVFEAGAWKTSPPPVPWAVQAGETPGGRLDKPSGSNMLLILGIAGALAVLLYFKGQQGQR